MGKVIDAERRLGIEPKLNIVIQKIHDDDLLTPEDMAFYMGISARKVRRKCKSGEIGGVLCYGRKYIVYGVDFKAYIKNCVVRPFLRKTV